MLAITRLTSASNLLTCKLYILVSFYGLNQVILYVTCYKSLEDHHLELILFSSIFNGLEDGPCAPPPGFSSRKIPPVPLLDQHRRTNNYQNKKDEFRQKNIHQFTLITMNIVTCGKCVQMEHYVSNSQNNQFIITLSTNKIGPNGKHWCTIIIRLCIPVYTCIVSYVLTAAISENKRDHRF